MAIWNDGAYMKQVSDDQYNYGVGLLRIILCIGVIALHYSGSYNNNIYRIMVYIGILASPIFMLLAFYYSREMFVDGDRDVFIKRMQRLIIPFITWSVIYFFAFSVLKKLTGDIESKLLITDLLWSVLLGHSPKLNPVLWFEWVLIVISIGVFVFFRKSGKKVLSIGIILFIVSFYVQYSGLEYNLLSEVKTEVAYPIGRLVEMIPFAIAGCVIARVMRPAKVMPFYGQFCILIITIVISLLIYRTSFPEANGFGYAGLKLFFLASAVSCGVLCCPLDKLPAFVKMIIRFLASYSMGVYCIHVLVGTCFTRINGFLCIKNSMSITLIIYAVSLLLCILISRIPGKWGKRIVQ